MVMLFSINEKPFWSFSTCGAVYKSPELLDDVSQSKDFPVLNLFESLFNLSSILRYRNKLFIQGEFSDFVMIQLTAKPSQQI